MKRFLKWFFSVSDEPRSWGKVIYWWEIRRIPYNLIVGIIGTISLLLFCLFLNLAHELRPGEDAIEAMMLIVAPIIINICYTAGWVVELFLRLFIKGNRSLIGLKFLKLGSIFSIIIVIFPSVTWFIIWIVRSLY